MISAFSELDSVCESLNNEIITPCTSTGTCFWLIYSGNLNLLSVNLVGCSLRYWPNSSNIPMKGRITMHQGKNSPPGILDGSLSLEFESRLNFNCLKSFLAVSLFTVVDDSFELQSFKVARSDFWVTMPFNFEQLELHYYKCNRKSNLSAVLEKDEIFKLGTFHQDLSYHSNEMTPCFILHKTE